MDLDVTMEGRLGVALPVATTALPHWHQELLLETTSATSPASRRKRQRFGLTTELPGARVYESDRFIPSRRAMDMDYCSFVMDTSDATASGRSASAYSAAAAAASGCSSSNTRGSAPSSTSSRGDDPRANQMDNLVRYQETLAANLLFTTPPRKKKTLLRFHERDALADSVLTSPTSVASHPSLAYAGVGAGEAADVSSSRRRHIPTSPTRILDAPELRDDYYLNLVSWGDHNVLAVALDRVVYLYNTDTGAIQEIKACDAHGDYVTSVAWMRSATTSCAGDSGAADSHWLAVGTCRAELQVWDTVTATKVRALRGHRDRIGALAWNGAALSSGARDATIRHHDLRAARVTTSSTATSATATTLRGHQQEICGLAWSPDGKTLASGGNDNCLCLWDAAMASSNSATAPRARLLQHCAAVKALAWCPWERHLLASGGGTADRTIKFWHAGGTPRLLDSVHTGSQVCGLVWSKTERELLSSHGFSQNELCLWKYPSMVRLREFTGHTARVLHLAMSPDGGSVVSAAADETLRFWNVFASTKRSTRPGSASLLLAPSDPRRPRGAQAFFPDAVIR